MTTVAIVSEYNPFHRGHEYQIKKVREAFGEDTAIIAIMSGNYTQRADVAICDKLIRAKCAVLGGVDLVLELPFPFSSSSAEIFASAAVSIANSLNIVDYLSFGSECGNIDALNRAADIFLSEEYSRVFDRLSADKALGYAKCCELAYKEILGKEECVEIDFFPNNILAIEYIKELKKSGSSIKPHTIKRAGMGYNETSAVSDAAFPSASYLRGVILNDVNSLGEHHMPKEIIDVMNEAIDSGDMPCDSERLSTAILSKFRLNSPTADDIYDAGGGLYTRLYNASFEANSLFSLLNMANTKKYTNARLRRAVLNFFFGVTSSDVRNSPKFTQVLAMDSTGMKLLKAIKKRSDFRVLTKPSDYADFDGTALAQKKLSERADFVFELTKPNPKSAGNALRLTPYIKK